MAAATDRLRGLSLVQPELEPLARLECQDLPRRDLDAVARLGIAAAPGRLAPDAEVAKPDDLHVLAALEAVEDQVEHLLHDRGRLALGQAVIRHRVDQIVLGQGAHPLVMPAAAGPPPPIGPAPRAQTSRHVSTRFGEGSRNSPTLPSSYHLPAEVRRQLGAAECSPPNAKPRRAH